MAKWKNIDTEKPNDGEVCLVANCNEVLGFAMWHDLFGWAMPKIPNYCWIGPEITHWMPLPEQPKE